MPQRLLLSLDSGSNDTGYCCIDERERILDAGVLKAKRGAAPEARIEVLANDLMVLLEKYQPSTIVIEMSSGRVYTRHPGGGRGLAILGLAIDRLWGQCELWRHTLPLEGRSDVEIHLIPENRWIAGRTKASRQQEVMTLYPSYDPAADKGCDASDAICLALWFWSERRSQALQASGGAK